MTRDDEFAKLAAEYAAADADVIEAERLENQARVRTAWAKLARDTVSEKMTGFVGPSNRIRNAVVGYKLVRVEFSTKPFGYDSTRDHVAVSVEDVTLTGVEVREGSP